MRSSIFLIVVVAFLAAEIKVQTACNIDLVVSQWRERTSNNAAEVKNCTSPLISSIKEYSNNRTTALKEISRNIVKFYNQATKCSNNATCLGNAFTAMAKYNLELLKISTDTTNLIASLKLSLLLCSDIINKANDDMDVMLQDIRDCFVKTPAT